MEFTQLVKAALELGVIPALALFLVVSMHLQNKQLLRDRREAEAQLLKTLAQVMNDYQQIVARTLQPSKGKTNVAS